MMSALKSRVPLVALSCLLLLGATGAALAQETITTEIRNAEVVSVYGNNLVVRDGSSGTLSAPADPGMYELRYILREGSKTLARAQIEVALPEVTIAAPATVLAGARFEVSWTGAILVRGARAELKNGVQVQVAEIHGTVPFSAAITGRPRASFDLTEVAQAYLRAARSRSQGLGATIAWPDHQKLYYATEPLGGREPPPLLSGEVQLVPPNPILDAALRSKGLRLAR